MNPSPGPVQRGGVQPPSTIPQGSSSIQGTVMNVLRKGIGYAARGTGVTLSSLGESAMVAGTTVAVAFPLIAGAHLLFRQKESPIADLEPALSPTQLSNAPPPDGGVNLIFAAGGIGAAFALVGLTLYKAGQAIDRLGENLTT